jgi:CheY-like chemotaxis protein
MQLNRWQAARARQYSVNNRDVRFLYSEGQVVQSGPPAILWKPLRYDTKHTFAVHTQLTVSIYLHKAGGQMARLSGRTILVVEDDGLIALDLTAILQSEGAEVLATADAKGACAIAHHIGLSAAILDVQLGVGRDCAPICRLLEQQRVPFIFYTGYRVGGVLEEFHRASVLVKPTTKEQLLNCVAQALTSRAPVRRYC